MPCYVHYHCLSWFVMQENVNVIVAKTHFRGKLNACIISNKNYQEFFNGHIIKPITSD